MKISGVDRDGADDDAESELESADAVRLADKHDGSDALFTQNTVKHDFLIVSANFLLFQRINLFLVRARNFLQSNRKRDQSLLIMV